MDTVCRACRVLQEVGALPLRRARAELLQPCGPVLQPLLQRSDLLLRQQRRALREARHIDHLLGHEGLHLRQRRMDLRCLFVVFFALWVNGWQCTSVAATRQETEALRAAPRDKRLGGVGAARTFAAVWSASAKSVSRSWPTQMTPMTSCLPYCPTVCHTIRDTVLTRLCCRNSCPNYQTSTVPHPTTCGPQGFDSLYFYRTVADDLSVRTAQRRGVQDDVLTAACGFPC